MHADVVIIGAGVSGSFFASELTGRGLSVVLLEAGRSYTRYPSTEVEASAELYWGGGIELNSDATLGLLRPKVVGGGSVVNQALLSRFDDEAWQGFSETSGIDFFNSSHLAPFYDRAESLLSIQEIPEKYRNENAKIFKEGFEKNGFKCKPLMRAQKNCHYEDGNDCIACLAGCPIGSKQSMPETVLKTALSQGLTLVSGCEAKKLIARGSSMEIRAEQAGVERVFFGKRVVLASGAIGNTKLLWQSGFLEKLPALGQGFYTHPQYMTYARYGRDIHAHRGAFQAFQSDDRGFRSQGFKLENVFAPPIGTAMLLPGWGRAHSRRMQAMSRLACIEVAIRDVTPGRIHLRGRDRIVIDKNLGKEDLARKARGLQAIQKIFESTGAEKIMEGEMGIGLHLMGGCAIGKDPSRSVINERFQVHRIPQLWCADSSVFPSAPGLNPSLSIMALSLKAAGLLKEEMGIA